MPPSAAAVIVPSKILKQFTFVWDINTVNALGWFSVISVVSKHPLESSTTTLYVPAIKLVILEILVLFWVNPVDHVKS